MTNTDPRRVDRIIRYKPVSSQGAGAGEDLMPDYMNILGMIFSMCGKPLEILNCRYLNEYFPCVV